MFERFTVKARKVIIGARTESTRLGHHYIGTEHLLVGLLEPGSVAAGVLLANGLTVERVRADIRRLTGTASHFGPDDAAALESIGIDLGAVLAKVEENFGPEPEAELFDSPGRKRIPLTKRAKKVLELALREAIALKHNYIGTEHLLLGIIREGEGLAAKIITDADINLEDLRRATISAIPAAA